MKIRLTIYTNDINSLLSKYLKFSFDINLPFKVTLILIKHKQNNMSFQRKYEITVVLDEKLNNEKLKTWALNYSKSLTNFNANNISITSRGKNKLAYKIKNKAKGNLYKNIHLFNKLKKF